MKKTFFAISAVSVVAAVAAVACQVVAGIDDRNLYCDHARWPSKPEAPNGADVAPIVFGLDVAISLSRNDGRGFDLDDACTFESRDRSTCDRCANRESTLGPEDDVNGRDNGAAEALSSPFFRAIISGATGTPSERFHLIVQVVGWNGQPNDPDVGIVLYQSHGAEPTQLDAGQPAPPVMPRRDGTDRWSTTSTSYVDGAPRGAIAGFVKESVLYGRPNNALDFELASAAFLGQGANDTIRLPVRLNGTHIMLPMTTTSSPKTIRGGVITGRWATTTLLSALSHIDKAEAGQPASFLCGTDESYVTLRQVLCRNADISASENVPAARCDAISVVFSATGTEGQLGSERFTLPPSSGCLGADGGAEWQDDCTATWEAAQCTFGR